MDGFAQMKLDDSLVRLGLVLDGWNRRQLVPDGCLVRLVLGLDGWNYCFLAMDGCCWMIALDDWFAVLLVAVRTAVGCFVVSY